MSAPPTEAELRKIVVELVHDVLKRKKSPVGPDGIKDGVSLTRDLGIDSLDILQISATVEKKYRFRLPESELKSMDDLGGIVRAVLKHWPA